jgi:hypothetical protein
VIETRLDLFGRITHAGPAAQGNSRGSTSG